MRGHDLFRYTAVVACLLCYVTIILGGSVITTDNGLACPDWPTCFGNGNLLPHLSAGATIEWSHRVSAFFLSVGVLVLALLGVAFERARRTVLRLSLAALALVVAEALLGGVVIESSLLAGVVLLHLAIATLLFGLLLILAVLANLREVPRRWIEWARRAAEEASAPRAAAPPARVPAPAPDRPVAARPREGEAGARALPVPRMTDPAPAAPPRSFARDVVALTKPGITALICLVAVGGFLLASPRSIDLFRLGVLVGCGALGSAGAAALNHYLDRDLDLRMHRTRGRPLAEERISPGGAAALGLVLLGAGVGLATVFLNPLTGVSILLGGVTYVVVYTLWLKRRSSWNIVIGGFAGSAPALAGSAAAVGGWTPGVVAFAILVFLWTPPHFWSLALLLKDDYARAGLPMLPRMDDEAYSGRVVVVSAALLVPAALLIGATGAVAWPVVVALVALGAIWVALAAPLWRTVSRAVARRGFLYSGPYLLAVVAALVLNAPLVRVGVPAGF